MAGLARWLPGALGAAIAIALTGYATHLLMAGEPALPWLVASMGATSVLVFVVPASPLAQPWPVAGGHLLAAAMGLLAREAAAEQWVAAGLAVGLAISVMKLASGLGFLIEPMAVNIALLLLFGLAWHKLTGHSYPHRAMPVPAPAAWVGHIEDEDLDAVLAEWDEVLDVSRDDLLALLHATEARVLDRVKAASA
jgi:CBS domain-containing membrane protein